MSMSNVQHNENEVYIATALTLVEAMRTKCSNTEHYCVVDLRSEGFDIVIQVSLNAERETPFVKYHIDKKRYKMLNAHSSFIGPYGKVTGNIFYYLLAKAISQVGATSESAVLIIAKKHARITETPIFI